MSENFLKFKKRSNAFRIIKSAMIGASAGLVSGGAWLMLIRLAVLGLAPLTSLFIGLGVALATCGLVFLLGGRSDKSLAEELDSEFGLNARVQTMIECMGKSGEMIALQREDADAALSKVALKSYKFKGLPIYILTLALSAAIFACGFIVPDMRDSTPTKEAFELTEEQETRILKLIEGVRDSGMEEEFSTPIVTELQELLTALRATDTHEGMLAAVTKSMAVIMDITYESSTATEMLNALWNSNDVYFKHLARVLDASSWESTSWGEFAEGFMGYASTLMGDNDDSEDAVIGKERLKSALKGMTDNLYIVLVSSGLAKDDEMYLAVQNIFSDEWDGLALILEDIDSLSEDEARARLVESLGAVAKETYFAILLNKTNADAGERVMRGLEDLFLVPCPELERPEFFKNNQSVGGGHGSTGDEDEEKPSRPGGFGPGATYGSDDLVLDPQTGELVRYGDLIDTYYAIMNKKLEGDFYTEEQKTAIRKYFEMLYNGIEKEEGK